MSVVEFWQIMTYILSSVLLVVLIVLGIKTIITMNKIENIVDNINVKVNKLNNLFNIIDVATDKLALISDKLVDSVASIISKIFNGKKRKEDENNE